MISPLLEERLEKLARELVDQYSYYRPWAKDKIRFEDLPIVDKTMINEQRESFQTPVSGSILESFTSGSTGVPFRCVKTPDEQLALSMAIHRHRRKWGLPLRYRSVLLGNSLLANQRIISQYAHQIASESPHMIQGRCSAVCKIAEYFVHKNWSAPESLLFIQNWGESLQPAQKKIIEDTFKVPVLNYYGMEEMWLIAFSNEHGRLEIDERIVHVEVVDSATGALLPEGKYGDILITSFVMKSMPFVRYRSGDMGRTYRDPASGKRILELLPFRASQIKLRDRTVDAAIFRYFDGFYRQLSADMGVKQFQLIQESYTGFRLSIVTGDTSEEKLTAATKQLETLLRQCLFTQELNIAIDRVLHIAPHPVSGKFHPFVSLVP